MNDILFLLFLLVDLLIMFEVAIRDRTSIYLLHGVHGNLTGMGYILPFLYLSVDTDLSNVENKSNAYFKHTVHLTT